MEANQIFNKLIHQIENSKLNYMITKRTPFSASVSLKSSFVKYFSDEAEVQHVEVKSEEVSRQETASEHLVNIECVTSEQRDRIIVLENIIDEQKVVIEETMMKLNQCHGIKKERETDFECQIADSREKLLKVKKEKHTLSTTLKVLKDENKNLREETKELIIENKRLKGSVEKTMSTLEAQTIELKAWKNENDNLQESLHESKSELKKYKLEKQTEDQALYACSKCDLSFNSYKLLKQHIRCEHCQSKATQKDKDSIFEEYPCYYCDETIFSTSELEKHATSCHEGIRMIEEYWHPCDICDTDCRSKVELEEHIKAYHYTYYNEEDLKSCDFCGLQFGTFEGLRSHIRSLHKEMLPT